MIKKTSKYFIFSGALLVLSLLLASCQSMIATTEAMDRKQAVDAWGANLTAQGESYLEETEKASVPLIELRSDVPPEAEMTEKVESERALEYWESYFEETEKASVPLVELRSDVPSEAEVIEKATVSLIELRSDVSAEAEMLVDAYSPGIGIQRTWLRDKTFLTVYTVMSDRPAWVVFHADEDGLPGAILQYIFVESGTHKIARTEDLIEFSSEQIHVMLHEDLGRIGLFEFPGPDGPVYVDNEIVNELCFCPF